VAFFQGAKAGPEPRYFTKLGSYNASYWNAGAALWQLENQDAAQRPTRARLGNGLTEQRNHNAYSGRLASATLSTADGNARLQQAYAHDALGNVSQRSHYWDAGGYTENFGYDELNRLTDSQVIGQAAQQYSYDAAGNLLSKTGLGAYSYPPQGAAAVRPHAVQSIAGLGGFGYDEQGNQTTAPGRTQSWTSYDHPLRLSKGAAWSEFVYGPEHQRAKQTRSDGAAIYYAAAQEVQVQGGQATVKTYWPQGLGLEIDAPGQASQLLWTHSDRQGSVLALSDSAGVLKEKLAYDAWGKRRTLDGAATPDSLDGQADRRGYTGHEMLDQLDLVHMNARVYDPQVARFASADPIIQAPEHGQSYNRYSYVWNNPTNLTDPTGMVTECRRLEQSTGCNAEQQVIQRTRVGGWETVYEAPRFEEMPGKGRNGAGSVAAQGKGGRQDAKGEVTGAIGPTPPNFFTDNFAGRILGNMAAPFALFTENNVNPLTGYIENFNGDKKAEAAIGILTLGIGSGARGEAALVKELAAAWKGAGPISGTFGVGPATESVKGLLNFFPRKGSVEFVFDPATSTFVVGNGAMKHSALASSIGADVNRVVGGMFKRDANGAILTNELSGHFWQNWGQQVRHQFVDFMNSKGVSVLHREGM
jgi:RHS repeat-associated protein